jgi:phytoene dehydrogenase-like protein
MLPAAAMDAAGWRQYTRFMSIVEEYARAVGADGRPAFAVPIAASSADPKFLSLDAISMAEWMERHGFVAAPLRWFVEYGTRDDYGTALNSTSAWAGLHYFASRESEAHLVTHSVRVSTEIYLRHARSCQEIRIRIRQVWADGLGSVVRRLLTLLGRAGAEVRTGCLVHRVRPGDPAADGLLSTVDYADAGMRVGRRLLARRVVYALPVHTAPHIIDGYPRNSSDGFEYAPWVVANVFLRAPLAHSEHMGVPPQQENMIYNTSDDFGLGWVLDVDRERHGGAGALRPFWWPVLTEIYLCDVCCGQEILRRHGRGQTPCGGRGCGGGGHPAGPP